MTKDEQRLWDAAVLSVLPHVCNGVFSGEVQAAGQGSKREIVAGIARDVATHLVLMRRQIAAGATFKQSEG